LEKSINKRFLKFLSFLPWIVYGLLTTYYPSWALRAATLSCLAIYPNLRRGFILDWGSLLFFLTALTGVDLLKSQWIAQHISLLGSFFLAAISCFSLLIGRPFTMDYAEMEVDKKMWDSPVFIRVNQITSAFLGLIFITLGLFDLYNHKLPGFISTKLIWRGAIALLLLFVAHFPNWHKK
jgi:carotenoid cleavage dioxygenase